jgi:hypothetical protein
MNEQTAIRSAGCSPVDNEITSGTFVPYVQDTRLAAVLIELGIPLRKDPPYTHRLSTRGAHIVKWHFESHSPDGVHEASALIKAWHEGLPWATRNAGHPLAKHIVAMHNEKTMLAHINNDVPMVGFRARNSHVQIYVKLGSPKHHAFYQLGYIPI